jgi:hypothetical protein
MVGFCGEGDELLGLLTQGISCTVEYYHLLREKAV